MLKSSVSKSSSLNRGQSMHLRSKSNTIKGWISKILYSIYMKGIYAYRKMRSLLWVGGTGFYLLLNFQ